MLSELLFFILCTTNVDPKEKIFYLVFIEMQMFGLRHELRTLPWAKCKIFLETLFICNNIDKHLNNNFNS